MKKIILYTSLSILTGLSFSSGLEVIAGGCSNHTNKNEQKECLKNDTECKERKIKNNELSKTLNS